MTVDALGYSRSVALDSNFHPIVVTATNGSVVRSDYNSLGLPTVTTATVTSDGVIQTLNTRTDYDASGNPLSMTDVRGSVTTFHYILPGKPDVVSQAGHITSYQYDGQGRVVQITSAAGMVTTYGYNSRDQVVAITKTYPTLVPGSTTPVSRSYRSDYQFNTQGWLLYQSDPYDTAVGPGAGMTYEYNTAGQVVTVTNQLGQKGYNQYDAVGNLISKTNFMGQQTLYTYDWLKRLTSVTEVAASGNLVTTYNYDQNGNMTSRTDPRSVTTSYTYDPLNQLGFDQCAASRWFG